MKKIYLLIIMIISISGCMVEPKTTEQPCKWMLDEKTQEYYELCK